MKIYVSPIGNDANDGTKLSPLATPDEAARRIPSLPDDEITVLLAPGEYRTNGIRLEKTGKKVTFAAEGGSAVINGGMHLTPDAFSPLTEEEKARLHGDAKEKAVRADLRALGLTEKDWGVINAIGTYHTARKYRNGRCGPLWCELFFNDRRMTIARYPDDGYLNTVSVIEEGQAKEPSVNPSPTDEEWEKLVDPKGDIVEIDADTAERMRTWKSIDDVWMFGYPKYTWADASSPLAAVNADARSMETEYVSFYGVREQHPYYIFNVFEELDAPGEWYLDRHTGILYLYPPAEMAGADICLSLMTEPLLAVNADDVTVKGLTFLGTRGNAMVFNGNRNSIRDCTVKNIGSDAITVTGWNNTVSGCEICYTGSCGVSVSGGDRNTLTPSGNRVENNHIHHIAEIFRTYRPGVRLSGVGNVCAHNCIHDSAHNAIGFGGNDNIIEYNEIYAVCLFADDSSAVYTGRDYATCGNIIRYNFFHDICSKAAIGCGTFAVYCDDNTGGTTITGNVFLRCQTALFLHGGHDMIFQNNLIIQACPNSPYSLVFTQFGYWKMLLPGGIHQKNLERVPWQGEIWTSRFPHIAEYLTWDPEHEQAYPHYCQFTSNIVVDHKPINIIYAWDDPRFHNRMENNPELDSCDGAQVDENGILVIDNEKLCALVPDFQPLPFDEMGLLK